MTITRLNIASITYTSEDTGPDAPCAFVWDDDRSETHPKSWTGFFRGVVGGRNASGDECEWYDGTGLNTQTTVAANFAASGGSIAPYVPPADPAP